MLPRMSALPPFRANHPRLLGSLAQDQALRWTLLGRPRGGAGTEAPNKGAHSRGPTGARLQALRAPGPRHLPSAGGSEQLNWTRLVCVLETINGVQLKGIQFKSIWQTFIECPLQVRL